QLIHHLMFAHDALPGVGNLDNLGLPESGDGLGDLMQIALHEARFVAKLQDTDGGFFFLVYPEDRKYEDDVVPDKAGGQIVFPKNTAATAAAAAALAQIGSSPDLIRADQASAEQFVRQAEHAWRFLERAWAEHGRDGAYQRISHYGDIFMDRDEIAWAATELFLATKDRRYHEFLVEDFRPGSEATHRWGWQRLFEGYGAATRSYAYAKLSGRADETELDPAHLRACQRELWDWGRKLEKDAEASSYGLSFPLESKEIRAAGWHFPISDTLDLVSAGTQSGSRAFERAIQSNIDYELGVNPTSTCFLPGLGTHRRFEIVHQWARNDEFHLPMTGIPVGAIVSGIPEIAPYGKELESIIFPPNDGAGSAYAFYDRVIDTFDVATESVSYQLGRGLASAAYLMAQTELAGQAYTHLDASITGRPQQATAGDTVELALELDHPDLQLDDALIVWEARGDPEPSTGKTLRLKLSAPGQQWAVVEAQWPDGRRAFARVEFTVDPGAATVTQTQPEKSSGSHLPASRHH
ncbi:MAG: glycoside hydrolase family 9 protein, partial [Verrucomicrobiales bacterium]